MNSKYFGSLGFKRLIKAVESGGGGGGGALTANSVNSSHIVNGTILGADLENPLVMSNIDVGYLAANEIEVVTNMVVNGNTTLLGTLSAGATTLDSLVVSGSVDVNSLVVQGTGDIDIFSAYEAYIGSNLSVQSEIHAQYLKYATRSGQKAYGTATLVGGTASVSNVFANTTSLIFLSRNNVVNANHMGHLYVVKGSGSFQINSTNNQDNNVVDYIIINTS